MWWLLALPLFFGLGWVAARIDIRQIVAESRSLPRAYLSGLNHLLDDRQDRAIDDFLAALAHDPDIIELHFALGRLFRRRGETDRAIRMHQALISRTDIDADIRLRATEQLGQDFLKAGLLDRAEAVFLRLRGTTHDDMAVHHLLEIYQQEKDWDKALDIADALPDHESVHWRTEVANFHCEIANTALADSRFADARNACATALTINPRCVRASMLLGDCAAAEGHDAEAIEIWKRIEKQHPVYLSLIAERLIRACQRLGRGEQGQRLLRAWLEQHPSLDLLDQVANGELATYGAASAYELVRDELRRNPTLLGLDKLLESALQTTSIEKRGDVELIRQLVHAHTRKVARYRCGSCGFKARQFHWRCPACGDWESYPPRRTEEFDLAP